MCLLILSSGSALLVFSSVVILVVFACLLFLPRVQVDREGRIATLLSLFLLLLTTMCLSRL